MDDDDRVYASSEVRDDAQARSNRAIRALVEAVDHDPVGLHQRMTERVRITDVVFGVPADSPFAACAGQTGEQLVIRDCVKWSAPPERRPKRRQHGNRRRRH